MDRVLDLHKFAGINTRNDPSTLGDQELSSAINFDLGLNGELVKRTGIKTVATNALGAADSIQILGFFSTDTYKQFIARSGNDLYYSTDAVAWTVIAGGPWNAVECGVQYTDKFYMVRKVGTVIEWNGLTAVGITNSPAGTFCKIFKDRLFVIHTEGAGAVSSRIYFSNALNLSSTGWPATNYVGVNEGDGDRLIALTIVSDYLMVFKTRAIWNLFVQGADTTSWILRPFRSNTGCISRHSIVTRAGVTFFCGLDGIYTTSGQDVQIISSPVGNFFDPITVDITTLNQVSAFFWKDKYVVALPSYTNLPTWTTWSALTWDQLSTTPWDSRSNINIYLVYHIRNKGWTRWDFSTTAPHRFVTVTSLASLKGVYCGERTPSGRVLKFGEDIYVDPGGLMQVSFSTKEYDLGKPVEKKRAKWIGLKATGYGPFVCTSTVDGNKPMVTSYDVSSREIKASGPGYFRTWQYSVSVNSNSPLSVYGLSMYYSMFAYRPIKATSS